MILGLVFVYNAWSRQQVVTHAKAVEKATVEDLTMERETRLELATLCLGSRCSTTELLPPKSILDVKNNAPRPNSRFRQAGGYLGLTRNTGIEAASITFSATLP